MTTREIIELSKGLEECFGLSGEEFSWKATLNYVALQDIRRQYEIKAATIADKYAQKDENGKLVMINETMMAIRDMAAYSAEMAKIDNTELHVMIQKVKRAELPKEITVGTLIKIRLMVEELCTEPIKEKKEDKKDV